MKKLLWILIAGWLVLPGYGQEEDREPIDPVLMLTYLKDNDNLKHLQVKMEQYIDRNPYALPGIPVQFFAGEDGDVFLGSGLTNTEGLIDFVVPDTASLPEDEEGMVRYLASYEGCDTIYPTENEVYITDVFLDMKLELVDSVKTVVAHAWRLIDGEEVPVADEDIYFYVPRMFSLLPIGEEFLDENGTASIEFPVDIPGDAAGMLGVVTRFNDHYLFGNVEKRQEVQWGVPTMHQIPEEHRALWTQIAPKWMIVTLTILLTGVWSHYIFVIFQMIRIKRLARKEETGTATA